MLNGRASGGPTYLPGSSRPPKGNMAGDSLLSFSFPFGLSGIDRGPSAKKIVGGRGGFEVFRFRFPFGER